MTSSPSRIQTSPDGATGIPKPDCCDKCGGPLQYRQMIVNGQARWIWQCKVCRFHQPA